MDELIDSLPTQHQRDAANEIINRAGTSDADWQVIKAAAELLAVEREARACDKAYRLERAAELVAGDYEPGGNLDPAKVWPDGMSHGTCCDQMQAKLAAAEQRAKHAKSYESDAILFRAERDLIKADRDRLRDALRTIHRMSPTDNTPAGIVKFAASLQRMADAALNATGEAAIADEHHHGGLPDIMSVAEARRREVGKAEPDVQP